MEDRPRIFLATLFAVLAWAPDARADEGGASFWLPGNFGSFAAVPADPGLSISSLFYVERSHADFDLHFTRGTHVTAGLDEAEDLLYLSPTYTFEPRIAGGRASLGLSAAFGRVAIGVAGTITSPNGTTRSGVVHDAVFGISDLYPTASLAWGFGAHNVMTYAMGGIPVGTYDPERYATIGLHYASIDGGAGYTYFHGQHEVSAVLGVTYNFTNPATDYRSGVSAHLDWAASEVFVDDKVHFGIVGYAYQQLTGDSGSGAMLGDFRSRVFAAGPQIGCATDLFGQEWYANLKSFFEFAAENRPQGWSVWMTLDVPIAGPLARRTRTVRAATAR